ncbi:MAG TPA: SurA N-terminal domain-containing protein [Myxococcota bacterium]|nr:SurA N-terminal domain-containing protein [Myxococcota bacterium]
MLDFMRKNANSWVMILLFGIIIFVFAINFGPWAGNSLTGVPYAAIVNNEAISMAEFRTAYASHFARIKQFRPDYDQAQADKDGLKQMVIDQLISRELLAQLGKSHHLSIGAKTLADEIKERIFGKDAEFNKDEYIRRVSTYFQTTVSQFEQQFDKDMIAQQVANLFETGVYVSNTELKNSFIDRNTKIALDFIKVEPDYFKSTKPVTPDEIKHYQEANGQKISDYYKEHISDYVKEEQIRASHILIKLPQSANAAEKETAKLKAQKILERIKNNEDFSEIAKNESEDLGTKVKGGDLGLFTRGMMVEEFSKAAFALKPGEVSEIVESPFGFHIIKQTEQMPKIEKKLEDASPEIAEILVKKDEQEQKAMHLAKLGLEQLQKGTAIGSIRLDGIINISKGDKEPVGQHSPIASESDLFSRQTPYVINLGRTEAIAKEAFNLTLEQPTAPKVIEANNAYFAIRLKAREEADMAKFEEQKDSIRMSLMYQRKRAMMQQYLTQLKEAAKIKYNPALLAANPIE